MIKNLLRLLRNKQRMARMANLMAIELTSKQSRHGYCVEIKAFKKQFHASDKSKSKAVEMALDLVEQHIFD